MYYSLGKRVLRKTLICAAGSKPTLQIWDVGRTRIPIILSPQPSLSNSFHLLERLDSTKFFTGESYQRFPDKDLSTFGPEMPSFDLFKYSKTALALSEDSLHEKLHHGQIESLLGEGQLPDRQKYDRSQWKTVTLRVCEIVVVLACILMFVLGLRWQLNANQHCLELQSFYCRHFRKILPEDFSGPDWKC